MSAKGQVNRDKNSQDIHALKAMLQNASIVLVSDYRGVSANQMNDLRASLAESGAEIKVYKNTLARLAFKEQNLAYTDQLLKGPSIIITTDGDSAKVSKILVKFKKENEVLDIKGGFLDKKILSQSQIQDLATLPSKEELIMKTIALIKQPLTRIVASVSSPIRGLVYSLQAIQKQKEEVTNG